MGVIVRPELNPGVKPVFGSGYRLNPWHPLNQGLVAWWLMNEGVGSKCFALGYPAYNAVENDAGGGNKLSFGSDGSGQYAYLNTYLGLYTSAIDTLSRFTIALRIQRLQNSGSPNSIFSNQNTFSASSGFGLWCGYNTNDDLFLNINGSILSKNDGVLPINTTKTVVASYDGSNRYIYVDGILWNSGAYSTPISASGVGYGIKRNSTNGGTSTFRIYWGGLWNRALNQSEVVNIGANPYGTPDNPRLLFPSTRRYFQAASGGGATQLTYSDLTESFAPTDALGGMRVYRASFGENLEN